MVILEAVERRPAEIEAPQDVKDEARGVVRRARETGVSIATTAAGSVLATAVRTAVP